MNRYLHTSEFPQPIRKIIPSPQDVMHILKMGERIDNLAQKYYGDATLGWIIMCANPEWDNEFDIPFGETVRIPIPLQRVFDAWLIDND